MQTQIKTWLGAAVIVVIALTAGMFIWYQQKIQPEVSQPAQVNIAKKVSITEEWQTYRNEKYGFEVKYPIDWEISAGDSKDIHCRVYIGNPLSGMHPYALCIAILDNPNSLNAKEFVGGVISDANKGEGPGLHFRERLSYSLNDHKVEELNRIFAFDRSEDRIYISTGKNIFEFSFPSADENSNFNDPVKNNAIARQILSTFKFTD